MNQPTNPARRIDAIIDDASDALSAAIPTLLMLHPSDSIHSIDASELDRNDRRLLLELHTLLPTDDAAHLFELMLSYSICPMHHIDYAICFDDDDPECAAIRIAEPTHDT